MLLREQAGATGDLGGYLDAIEAEASARFGLTVDISADRHRLGHVHGGRPAFPGWFPRVEGGAPDAFWLDFRFRGSSVTTITGGALLYRVGPVGMDTWVNAGGMDADGHEIRLAGEAAAEAGGIEREIGFSGNLWVDPGHRKSDISLWAKMTMPLLNKVVAMSVWPGLNTFVTFVRDAQLDNLAPHYCLPVLVPGVSWWRRFQGTAALHLGVQKAEEALAAIRAEGSRSTQPSCPAAA